MIKIIGDVKKAKEALGTNVNLKSGQQLNGNEKKMKTLCQKYPELFEWAGKDWSANMKKSPSKNKMMKKNIFTKKSDY